MIPRYKFSVNLSPDQIRSILSCHWSSEFEIRHSGTKLALRITAETCTPLAHKETCTWQQIVKGNLPRNAVYGVSAYIISWNKLPACVRHPQTRQQLPPWGHHGRARQLHISRVFSKEWNKSTSSTIAVIRSSVMSMQVWGLTCFWDKGKGIAALHRSSFFVLATKWHICLCNAVMIKLPWALIVATYALVISKNAKLYEI